MQIVIQLSVLILFYSQLSTADVKVNSSGSVLGPHYEYDPVRNGWYIPSDVAVNPLHSRYPNVPEIYHDFVNRTLSRKPTGVCQKEVPATTLLEGNTTYHHSISIGNGSNPAFSRINVCCQGYQRDPHIVRKCNPICENECVNGICFSPNECICYPDHVKNLGGHCVPTCPIACDNGQCNGNTCVCKPGFQLDRTGKLCIPVCNPSCGKGNCTAPNVCSCNRGYESDRMTGECIPKCTHGCDYGHCVAPEKCECGQGYLLQNAQCTPVCSKGCVNGVCTAPNKCSCREGYTIDKTGSRCDAKCDRPCLNGQCNRPNQCDCNPGYKIDPTEPFKCNAHCPEPCVNGVCSSPGFCICNVGYVKDRSQEGSQICIPRA